MSMSLAALEILEEAQLPAAQARAIVRAIEADSSKRFENVATKTDLALLKGELKSELIALRGDLRGELVRWIFAVIMGQTAVLTGIMYFLLNLMKA